MPHVVEGCNAEMERLAPGNLQVGTLREVQHRTVESRRRVDFLLPWPAKATDPFNRSSLSWSRVGRSSTCRFLHAETAHPAYPRGMPMTVSEFRIWFEAWKARHRAWYLRGELSDWTRRPHLPIFRLLFGLGVQVELVHGT